ncbi:sigma factor [Monashia sp. NPDC004114]
MPGLSVSADRVSCATDPPPIMAAGLEDASRIFLAERSRLLSVAYRTVHDLSTAEDVVQDAWVRWQRTDRGEIRNPAAFLTTTTTRLAINVIESAHHRHEVSLPPDWLPHRGDKHAGDLARTFEVEQALMTLMSRLSRPQLAALVLRKCFDFAYGEVAKILGTTPSNARQLVRRARINALRAQEHQVESGRRQRMVAAFEDAAEKGDLTSLIQVLVP